MDRRCSCHLSIGAVVKVVTDQGAQWVTATTSGSYLSASDPRVHFGLGNTVLVPSIEVRWPSGASQTLTNVKADQQLQVDEPSGPNSRSLSKR